MRRSWIACLFAFFAFAPFAPLAVALEFPIAAGRDSTFAFSASFNGSNYLVGIQGDTTSTYRMTAQRVSPAGALLGPRISLGRTGDRAVVFSGPLVTWDGVNHLLIWTDRAGTNDDVYGQFVAPAGSLVGSPFPIAASASNEVAGAVAAGTASRMVVWAIGSVLYGQLVNSVGAPIAGPVLFTSNVAFNAMLIGETAAAFDGTRYLVVWQSRVFGPPDGFAVMGCFVDQMGSAGASFVISAAPSPSYNPLALAWNGSNYLVVWNRDMGPGYPSPTIWDLYGRLVSPAGAMGPEFVIDASPGDQIMPSVASTASSFLVTWTDLVSVSLLGKALNSAGVGTGPSFTVFAASAGVLPVGALASAGYQFLAVGTRLSPLLGNGDVFGSILPPVGVGVGPDAAPKAGLALRPSRPNPFRDRITVSFELPAAGAVWLSVYDLAGRQVARLVDGGTLGAGDHTEPWDASEMAAGVYVVELRTPAGVETQRIVRLR